MEATSEPAEPIAAVCEESSSYSPPSYRYKRHFIEGDIPSYEESQAKYERPDDVHVGPAAAHTAPSARQPSEPTVGGVVQAPAQPANVAPQPVANVAIIAALNNGANRGRVEEQLPRDRLPSFSNVSDDGSSSSISFSDWTEESSSDEDTE